MAYLYAPCYRAENDYYIFEYTPGDNFISRSALDGFKYPDIPLSDYEIYDRPLEDIDAFEIVVREYLDDQEK